MISAVLPFITLWWFNSSIIKHLFDFFCQHSLLLFFFMDQIYALWFILYLVHWTPFYSISFLSDCHYQSWIKIFSRLRTNFFSTAPTFFIEGHFILHHIDLFILFVYLYSMKYFKGILSAVLQKTLYLKRFYCKMKTSLCKNTCWLFFLVIQQFGDFLETDLLILQSIQEHLNEDKTKC